ncbi:hypothetical protein [Demequina aurantiaca]|uniref:hypothetical protein n=1 Tax=Demequina aurantiaca TaxID=676200 RepID=UPI003D3495CB
MTDGTTEIENAPRTSPLVRSRAGWLFWATVMCTVFYAAGTTASRSWCLGGANASGEYIDAAGAPTDSAPMCVNLTLGPSAQVFLTVAVIAISALVYAYLRRHRERAAVNALFGATMAIVAITLGSMVVAQVWFSQVSGKGLDESGHYTGTLPSVVADTTIEISPADVS